MASAFAAQPATSRANTTRMRAVAIVELRHFRQRIASAIVHAVEFGEFSFDRELFGLQGFLARLEWLDHDAIDRESPCGFAEMLALPGQRMKRDADVKQIAVRMIVPVQKAGRLDVLFEKRERLGGDVAFEIRNALTASDGASMFLCFEKREHSVAVCGFIIVGEGKSFLPARTLAFRRAHNPASRTATTAITERNAGCQIDEALRLRLHG